MGLGVHYLWRRALVLVVLLGWLGCAGVPNTPILDFKGKAECDPTKVVGATAFAKGGKAYGCLSLTNTGKDDQVFPIQINKDGTYMVQDPSSGEFTDEKIGAAVAAGVEKINIDIYFLQEDPAKINKDYCTNIAKEKVAGCLANAKCLFVWRGEQLPLDRKADPGTCRICSKEKCNGKDDNCDGTADENNACGTIIGYRCEYGKETPGPCTPAGPCRCVVTPQGKQICYGTKSFEQKWKPYSEVQAQCTAGSKFFCNSDTIQCDQLK
jgi:hypothetical protein